MLKDDYSPTSDPANHEKLVRMKRWPGLQDRWQRREVRIWSEEHRAFWRPDGKGYTSDPSQAWKLPFEGAFAVTKHAGPEKQIRFRRLLYDEVRAITIDD